MKKDRLDNDEVLSVCLLDKVLCDSVDNSGRNPLIDNVMELEGSLSLRDGDRLTSRVDGLTTMFG